MKAAIVKVTNGKVLEVYKAESFNYFKGINKAYFGCLMLDCGKIPHEGMPYSDYESISAAYRGYRGGWLLSKGTYVVAYGE